MLLTAFKSGEMGIKSKLINNDKMIYPNLKRMDIDYEKETIQFVFVLPYGLDPEVIKKKQYCFEQVFGKQFELKAKSAKLFLLTIYTKPFTQKVIYDYQTYSLLIKDMKMPVICGMNLKGETVIYDMVEENKANILVGGNPGSGKSSQIRSILTTLILHHNPTKLHLHLADLKGGEFHLFRDIPHVKGVYKDAHSFKVAMFELKKELARRGELLDYYGQVHIDNLPFELPYILVCIDEFAELAEESEVQELVRRYSSLGRALGCFLINSTQRPSADLLKTSIRSNMNVRMGFQVADKVNARICGTPGSENIEVKGRMICKINKPFEVQAPFLDDNACKKLLERYKSPSERKLPKDKINILQTVPPIQIDETKQNDVFEVLGE